MNSTEAKRKGIDSATYSPQIYAIKVVKKQSLLEKGMYQMRQMVREIQIQREMRFCGNSIKLLKIYETDKYLNIVMEY
jgi:serine/threonine protein kinase